MSETFDVVIIGGGPGGYNCATPLRTAGPGRLRWWRRTDKLGGTCPELVRLHPLQGHCCTPRELYETASKDFAGLGIEVTGLDKLDHEHAEAESRGRERAYRWRRLHHEE